MSRLHQVSRFSTLNMADTSLNTITTIQFEYFVPTEMQYQRWIQRFEGSCSIFQIKDEARVPHLLQYLSAPVYNNLCDNFGAVSPYTKKYKDLTDKLKELYEPEALEIAEIFRFNNRKQLPGEDVQTYANALSALSENCKFDTYKDKALRNQFVCGLSSTRTIARLLETKDLDFKGALSIARSMELSKKEVSTLQGETSNTSSVNMIQAGKKNPKASKKKSGKGKNSRGNSHKPEGPLECYRCGGGHSANNCQNKESLWCNFCKRKGHITKVCLKRKKQNQSSAEVKVLDVQPCESDESDIL